MSVIAPPKKPLDVEAEHSLLPPAPIEAPEPLEDPTRN
jgi:hypothetical protein